ncbi:Crp/Fnr family transcriptional regulator [Jiulongibacter sp. NS-SX5]|uniref:Crp/Fnr family transcriptional regulator n=1 Tax=Jiulongibacter sp. NS-SX5 TaxID=3463854 RepID=UPI00405849A3
MKQIDISKGTLLQGLGEYNTKVYRVHKGLLRSYSVDSKGKEHVFMLAPEGWLVGDHCEPDQPSELYIDALEDSIVIPLQKEIKGEIDSVRVNKRFATLQRRIISLMSKSALDRYMEFLETYPQLANRVSQKNIASYLGITPEALSKIRRRITHNAK